MTTQRYMFLSALLVVAGSQISLSQNSNLSKAISYYEDYENYNSIKSFGQAKEKIDSAAKHPSTADKSRTWFYRGKIYLAQFDMNLKSEMNKSPETDINKKIIAAYNAVPMLEVDEALRSFERCIELDDKKIYEPEAKAKIKVIASNYGDKGYASLRNENFKAAIQYYDRSLEMKQRSGIVDTASLFNVSIAAIKQKDVGSAEKYLNRLIELQYGAERCYINLVQLYNEVNDTASARKTLDKAVAQLPNSYTLLVEQINLYLRNGHSEKAVLSIKKALAKNPDNFELHLVLGQTYNKLAFPKDAAGNELTRPANSAELAKLAEEEFNKTISLKGDHFDGFYFLGIFYNNLGAYILKQAEALKEPQAVKAEEDKADEYFRKSIPLLEKANSLTPGNKEVVRTLKQLYLRTGQGDTEKFKKLDQ